MKLRSSTKIAIGFIFLLTLTIGGYQYWTRQMVANLKFEAVMPGVVSVVGIDPRYGYQLIVANQMAQLVKGDGGFQSTGTEASGAMSGAVEKRIPVREMLGTLSGDPKEIGEFVRIMNNIVQDEKWPTNAPVWTSEDIDKAFAGDQALTKKLESDINMKLDGTPLPSIRPNALFNGILVNFPVTLTAASPSGPRTVEGRLELPYRPRLLRAVEGRLADKNADNAMIAGYYAEEARKDLDNPAQRENVRELLGGLYSESRVNELRQAPEHVLKGAQVLINETHITSARSEEVLGGNEKQYKLTMQLSDEGRKRLWKYSSNRVGSYVMLVVNGVAVAAPKISHPLTQDELTVGGMGDLTLVNETVDAMNKVVKKD